MYEKVAGRGSYSGYIFEGRDQDHRPYFYHKNAEATGRSGEKSGLLETKIGKVKQPKFKSGNSM